MVLARPKATSLGVLLRFETPTLKSDCLPKRSLVSFKDFQRALEYLERLLCVQRRATDVG